MFEKRVLKRLFGPKREEVTGHCKKLNNEFRNFLLCSKYYYNNQMKEDEMDLTCSMYEKYIHNFRWETREVASYGRPMLTWKNNIKVGLKDTGYEYVDWIF
jgi:hypothetical protein